MFCVYRDVLVVILVMCFGGAFWTRRKMIFVI